MLQALSRSSLLALSVALAGSRLAAHDFFIAPNGAPAGPGTLSQPYDLATPLLGQVGQPGDTFWLRGGQYELGHLNTTVQGAPGSPITFREVRGEHARVDGSISLFDSIGYVVFRDFELYSSDTNRISAQTNVGFNPTDITNITGFNAYSPNVSLINLVVHDETRSGIYFPDTSSNTLVYGCVIYNNGWVSADNAEGHGIYAQSNRGTSLLADNIVFNNSGAGLHVYQNSPGEDVSGITLEGNVAFNAGAIQHLRGYLDWIIGVDAPGTFADGMILRENMGYDAENQLQVQQMQVGREGTNGSVVLEDNYMPLGLWMNNWSNATVSGNLFAPRPASYVINLNQTLSPLKADWDNNTYVCDPTGGQVLYSFQPYSFVGWQVATGFDLDSLFEVGSLHGVKVFVRTNLYEPGRANIIVYNWDNLDTVTVDVSSVLPLGSGFEVRNAQDPFASPVLRGVYHGQRLTLPMTNLTVGVPNVPPGAALSAPPPTGPTFNVFVLLPLPEAIQIQPVNGAVRVYWPVGAGPDALQWSLSLGASAAWTDSINSPVVVGDQFMILERASGRARFYRLRPSQPAFGLTATRATPLRSWTWGG